MTLFLVGGGPSQATGPIFDSFVAQARKRGPRIAVAVLGTPGQAAETLERYSKPITEQWPQAVIEPIWLVDADEGSINWPADAEQLGGLIVAGGWATGYLDALAPQRDEIVRLVSGGLPYLGFGAGALIVAKHAIVGGWQSHGREIGPEIAGDGSTEIVVRDGLGLIGSAIDVHTNTQHLLERPIAALLDHQLTSAIAIDDDTALVVDVASGRSEVAGTGLVHWLTRNGDEVQVRRTAAVRESADKAAQEKPSTPATGTSAPEPPAPETPEPPSTEPPTPEPSSPEPSDTGK
jgi:cyanophycinase